MEKTIQEYFADKEIFDATVETMSWVFQNNDNGSFKNGFCLELFDHISMQ